MCQETNIVSFRVHFWVLKNEMFSQVLSYLLISVDFSSSP